MKKKQETIDIETAIRTLKRKKLHLSIKFFMEMKEIDDGIIKLLRRVKQI